MSGIFRTYVNPILKEIKSYLLPPKKLGQKHFLGYKTQLGLKQDPISTVKSSHMYQIVSKLILQAITFLLYTITPFYVELQELVLAYLDIN